MIHLSHSVLIKITKYCDDNTSLLKTALATNSDYIWRHVCENGFKLFNKIDTQYLIKGIYPIVYNHGRDINMTENIYKYYLQNVTEYTSQQNRFIAVLKLICTKHKFKLLQNAVNIYTKPLTNTIRQSILANNIEDWYYFQYYIERSNDNSNNLKNNNVFNNYESALINGCNYSTQSFLKYNIYYIYHECWKLQSTIVLNILNYNIEENLCIELKYYKHHINTLYKQHKRYNLIIYYSEYQRSISIKIKSWINAINSSNDYKIKELINNIVHYCEIPYLTTRERFIIKRCIKEYNMPFHSRYSGPQYKYRTLHLERYVKINTNHSKGLFYK